MDIHSLPKTTIAKKKRRGQGYGSGKGGHTSGRGQKGQRSRGGIPLWFEGGQLPQIRRFPFIRGKRRFQPVGQETVSINISRLSQFPSGTIVNPKTLVTAGIISESAAKHQVIKLLGRGSVSAALTVEVLVSAGAEAKITAAGGKVINREPSH